MLGCFATYAEKHSMTKINSLFCVFYYLFSSRANVEDIEDIINILLANGLIQRNANLQEKAALNK